MIAVDTNIVIRFLTGDDPSQSATAEALFASEEIWIAKTVLLETEWVLRSVYGFDANAIYEGITGLLGLENVRSEDNRAMGEALRLAAQGVEFADAINLSSRPLGVRFASFDKALVRRAQRAGLTGVYSPPPKR